MAEFLPLCDLLFNVVSLASYFCDLVFDVLVTYALYQNGLKVLFVQCLAAVVIATLVTQFLSLRWYLQRKPVGVRLFVAIALHLLQCGVLWRYARLLVPVRLSSVKREVRDLCILRLVHGFLQAAPMLLLQLTLLPGGKVQIDDQQHSATAPPADLVTVSASLSLFSVCWSLASFSKHVQHVDRLVLTWLGVVSQLAWRGGTVTSRALALSAYAATHRHWVLLVLALHWSCMFLWLALSARGREGARMSGCALVAAVYVLAYINLQEKPHKRTMAIFYVVMLLENCMLVGVWLAAVWPSRPDHWELVPVLTVGLFIIGILFMLLYYRFFHVRRVLSSEKPANSITAAAHPPGVFNCRFATGNPSAATAFYRKKKKPTTFVPPPSAGMNMAIHNPNPSAMTAVPFWRRPLPSSSENEGSSVGSRVNIHQKLQEKKQKQLAELRVIEEEIKQGKLVGPGGADFDDRQPIPRAKRHHHHVEPQLLSLASLNNLVSYGVNLNRRPPPRAPRSRTPELLLAPRYLYCDCSIVPDATETAADELQLAPHVPTNRDVASDIESQVSLPRSYTLPREFKYYGGRQRVAASGRPVNPRTTAVASTNSSDGDVDSADDDEEDDEDDDVSDCRCPGNRTSPLVTAQPVAVRHLRRPFRHETKL